MASRSASWVRADWPRSRRLRSGTLSLAIHQRISCRHAEESHENVNDELERLRTENEALKKAKSGARMKVSEKGAVSVYGIKLRIDALPITFRGISS
jgi:hypothetical protein